MLDLASARRRLGSEHLIVAIVATAVVTVGAFDGGYGAQFRAALTLLAWWGVILVVVLGLRPQAPLPRSALLGAGCLVGLAALTALSMSWASDDGRAFTEVVRASGYAGLLVLVVLLAPNGSARAWLTGLGIGLAALAGLALASRLQPSAFPESQLIQLAPEIQGRLSYPVGYWNGLATCTALGLVLLAWLQSEARGRLPRSLATAVMPVPALALFLTSSRGGVAALLAGLAVLVALEPRRSRLLLGLLPVAAGAAALIGLALERDEFVDGPVGGAAAASQGDEMMVLTLLVVGVVGGVRYLIDPLAGRVAVGRRTGVAVVAAAGVLVVAGAAAADPARRIDEFTDPPRYEEGQALRHLSSSKGQGRYQIWEAAWSAFESQPLRGIGAGGYEAWWTRERTIFHPARDAHSLYLETLAELGIAGTLLLLGFFAAVALGASRAVPAERRQVAAAAGVLAAGALAAAIDWMWELPVVFGVVIVAAGVLIGPAVRHGSRPDAWTRPSVVATVAVAVAGAAVGALGFLGEAGLADSREAAARGDLGRAAEAARDAHSATPWSGAPWLQLALVEERRDLPAARAALDRAAAAAPDDWRVWLVTARVRIKAGDGRGAVRALARARRLNPRSTFLR